ncbi:hypothetical protein EN871_11655 [bacterium M00.F.Ca.ET.228.01.1.1]|uniref:hypothetical protein n=2 Tax=Pseudomonadota TaxID=1224 RepID=UPI001092F086|nr:hypothetical protein [Paraburkholderia phenoliruptrix]TGP43698.1 hypothetical protein EN871_11655 [bacterium M00.F.Ca.ET.228.01.1.1]TGS01360.1 hypothetical protein EN834_11650 [bacterium M00.F.Ca.ET.191.01.1.1]TGU09034.1 hypothetical protein EN798_07880 [bacterium M00.F.Ca.ET.155.01.1.1]MBW0449427.1 hypothetical protein [Paraburkholderia phenoliruptrix]MBW9097708.1 hypothetical protein [Paraburkholderia phenoliruptrix]
MTTQHQTTAEFAHDLQTGLARRSVPEFEQLPIIGMAASLALHIRGLGEIDYAVMKPVADYYFDIPSMVLPQVLTVMAEVGHIRLLTEGKSIRKIIPMVPHFTSVYEGLGGYVSSITLTEHEQLSVAILRELSQKAEKRDALFNRLGADTRAFSRVETITQAGGLVVPKRARGQDVLVCPTYFADNLDALASLAAAGSAKKIEKIISIVKSTQGWPLSIILKTGEVNGTKLDASELALLQSLVADGILKPPTIKNVATGTIEHFIFTPKPGKARLDGANRIIFERSMALAAAVRKGQLLPNAYPIKYPVALLRKLRDEKSIGATTEAAFQYQNLVSLSVGRLDKVGTSRYKLSLIDTPENVQVVDGAIALFSGGAPFDANFSEEARIALQKDEAYMHSIVGAAHLRAIERPELDEAGKAEVEQLLLDLR